jgi:hypothetical protein
VPWPFAHSNSGPLTVNEFFAVRLHAALVEWMILDRDDSALKKLAPHRALAPRLPADRARTPCPAPSLQPPSSSSLPPDADPLAVRTPLTPFRLEAEAGAGVMLVACRLPVYPRKVDNVTFCVHPWPAAATSGGLMEEIEANVSFTL